MTKRDLRPATWCRSADAFSLKQPHTVSSESLPMAAKALPVPVRSLPVLPFNTERYHQRLVSEHIQSAVSV